MNTPLVGASSVCTLFEGDYHFGLGALTNSLYKNGFRGDIWAGYKGKLPPWSCDLQEHDGYHEFRVADECRILFVPVNTPFHLANYKPDFMLFLWEIHCRETVQLFYFDPDIVIKCRWSFFEEWAFRGIALCQEVVNAYMPADHPTRLALKEFVENSGFECHRFPSQYFNSGFIGLHKRHASALCIWRDLHTAVSAAGLNLNRMDNVKDSSRLFNALDQDLLNAVAMVTPSPLSTVGPDGMDFVAGGFIMSHAAGGTKPWRKRLIREALMGVPPTSADKGYWQNTANPIDLYPDTVRKQKFAELRCGAAIGRFMSRS